MARGPSRWRNSAAAVTSRAYRSGPMTGSSSLTVSVGTGTSRSNVTPSSSAGPHAPQAAGRSRPAAPGQHALPGRAARDLVGPQLAADADRPWGLAAAALSGRAVPVPERRRVQPRLETGVVPPPGHHQPGRAPVGRSEEHTSELQSRPHLVCRLLLEKKKTKKQTPKRTQRRSKKQHR